MKFGGSSIGTPEAIAQVAGLVVRYAGERPVLTVSALQGVTDALIACANAAATGHADEAKALLEMIRIRHPESDALLGECEAVMDTIAESAELPPAALDMMVSFGERLSAPIVAAALRERGLDAVAVDARDLIVTDDHFTSAEVDFAATDARIRKTLLPLIGAGSVPVVTGFIGATKDGATTTLGRGGSDYTAAILGGALEADEIWIWKEVDGVMTADPRIVPDAVTLSDISYDEAAEMSYFGAKVLHPKTMIPAIKASVPLRIRNTFRPDVPGTSIGPDSSPAPHGVKVVTAIKKLAVVSVEGKGMAGIAGFAANVFGVAGRLRINIVMFSQSSSEQTICLVVPSAEAKRLKTALEEELGDALTLRNVEAIRVDDEVAAVAVVGEGMKGRPGIAARIFSAVAAENLSVLAIAQGSSERNVSFVVRDVEADQAVRAVHKAFELEKLSVKKYASA